MLSLLLWTTAAEARAFEMSGGVRMGYSYMPNSTLRSPNSMTLGFEQIHRLDSGGSLNFLVLTNFSLSGMNQGALFPTGHVMMGYQLYDSWYVGAGPFLRIYEVEPTLDAQVNMILGSGVLLPMEGFDIPIQFGYVPDLDDKWIFTMSTGIHYTF